MALIALLIFGTTGWPVMYRQKRIGLHGKPFWLLKFRTMEIDADQKQEIFRKRNEAGGPVFKIHDDPRFTPVGKFLSHTGLDELPQLWNVVRGEMAIIGPRPLPVEEAGKLTHEQHKRENIKPGIISPWIVQGYHKNSFDEWMKSDLRYIQKKSLLYDATLSVWTVLLFYRLVIRELNDRAKVVQ